MDIFLYEYADVLWDYSAQYRIFYRYCIGMDVVQYVDACARCVHSSNWKVSYTHHICMDVDLHANEYWENSVAYRIPYRHCKYTDDL